MKRLPVRFDPHAAVEFRHLPPGAKRDVKAALRALSQDPSGHESGLDVMSLDVDLSDEIVWRLRVGDWRVIFFAEARFVRIARVFHRSEGYEWLDRWLVSVGRTKE